MNILITGGTKGIGLATAIALSRSDVNRILIIGRDSIALKKAAGEAAPGKIIPLCFDLSGLRNDDGVLLKMVSDIFTGLDVLINNAGVLITGDFDKISMDDARQMTEINFMVPAVLIRELLPLMRQGSHIINISSMGGFQGAQKFRGLSFYSASKAALACLTECLAVELEERKISVNCLAPGSVDTEMFRQAFPGYCANLNTETIADFISWFAVNGNKYYNGKILPLSTSTP